MRAAGRGRRRDYVDPVLLLLVACSTPAPPPAPEPVVLPAFGTPRPTGVRTPVEPDDSAWARRGFDEGRCQPLDGPWAGSLVACYGDLGGLVAAELDAPEANLGDVLAAVLGAYVPGGGGTLVAEGGGVWTGDAVRVEIERGDALVHVRAMRVD